MQRVISRIVSKDQSGYLKGRYIGNNVRLLNDLIKLSEQENIPEEYNTLICLDFEKAFDTLEWDFMFETLKFFNFGIQLINWTKFAPFGFISYGL